MDLKDLTNVLKDNKLNVVWPSIVRNFYKSKDETQYELSYGIAKIGDIVLAKLIEPNFAEIEFHDGRIGISYRNQLIVGALGYRESTISYVGIIPKEGISIEKKEKKSLSLLSKSGLMGSLISKSIYWEDPPKLEVISLFKSKNKNLNLNDFGIEASKILDKKIPLLIVIGSSSECGKTTVCAFLIRFLRINGIKVSAVKLTGAGSMRDKLKFIDSGAFPVYDFVDGGLASTPDKSSIIPVAKKLLNKAIEEGSPDLIIVELAGSLLVEANKSILLDKEIRRNIIGNIFVSNDEVGAIGGLYILQKYYKLKPLFFSGKATDTIAGINYITKETGIPAVNFSNIDKMIRILIKKLKNYK